MGQKVNPKIFRIGTLLSWNSKWFSSKNYITNLKEDTFIRSFLKKKLKEASIDKVEIERTADTVTIIIYSSRPGVVIGKGGSGVDEIKTEIEKIILASNGTVNIKKKNRKKIKVDIKEVSKPNLSANIVAQNIALEIERRVPYRRAMKKNIEQVLKAGAKGVKVVCAGRLGGVEIARTEILSEGKIPLHTLRADIDYSRLAARTIYGAVGIKVWIYKGDVFFRKEK